MTVTVVIATRNRRDSLMHTLAALDRLPERPPVIVVDNLSDDGSPEAVRRSHPRVRLIEPGENLGAAARTQGVLSARTPFVAFSDDDSWWDPGALRDGTEILRADPCIGLVAARIMVEPGTRLDPTCRLMEQSPLPLDPAVSLPQILGFVACGALVRRDAFLAVGGFEPRLQVGGEEALLAIDLRAAGWRLVYAPEVVARHRPHPGGREWRQRRELRNALWTVWLRRPLPAVLARTIGLLAAARAGRARGLAAALRGLPWVLGRRRPVSGELEQALRAIER
jgi:GT2 family glycosyltransferase